MIKFLGYKPRFVENVQNYPFIKEAIDSENLFPTQEMDKLIERAQQTFRDNSKSNYDAFYIDAYFSVNEGITHKFEGIRYDIGQDTHQLKDDESALMNLALKDINVTYSLEESKIIRNKKKTILKEEMTNVINPPELDNSSNDETYLWDNLHSLLYSTFRNLNIVIPTLENETILKQDKIETLKQAEHFIKQAFELVSTKLPIKPRTKRVGESLILEVNKQITDKKIPDEYMPAWNKVLDWLDYTEDNITSVELNNIRTPDEFVYLDMDDGQVLNLFSDGKYWYSGDDDSSDFTNTIGATSIQDAKKWLDSKIEEYGNTYFFPAPDKIELNRLINDFGNTYFWNRANESVKKPIKEKQYIAKPVPFVKGNKVVGKIQRRKGIAPPSSLPSSTGPIPCTNGDSSSVSESVESSESVFSVTYDCGDNIYSCVMVKASSEEDAKTKFNKKKNFKVVGTKKLSNDDVQEFKKRGMSIMEDTQEQAQEHINENTLDVNRTVKQYIEENDIYEDTIDIFDDTFDSAGTSIFYEKNPEDNYDRFCNYVASHLIVTQVNEKYELCVNWVKFINDNIDALYNWIDIPFDDDYDEDDRNEYLISQLEGAVSGNTSERAYAKFLELI